MSIKFEVLAYEDTQLGILCLRRRLTLREPQRWVTEVTLNHEFLMSSLHTDSEEALAKLAIERVPGKELHILVGGLGLGYTAAAALDSDRVTKVEVVEFLPQVIDWMNADLIPLSERLKDDSRLTVVQGDVYERLLSAPSQLRWDAILIDVDHSPEDQLSSSDHGLYSALGLKLATKHLRPGGILALWSYEGNDQLADAMRSTMVEVDVLPVKYYNQHVSESFTDWLFVGKCAE
ncbi:spermidine synthase [Aureliella helgolandensis]|nr:spermidine synthase [Aureliella helgolandensis]